LREINNKKEVKIRNKEVVAPLIPRRGKLIAVCWRTSPLTPLLKAEGNNKKYRLKFKIVLVLLCDFVANKINNKEVKIRNKEVAETPQTQFLRGKKIREFEVSQSKHIPLLGI
jgi:hypothetical protein